jgi:hypothetical protein
MDRETLVYVDLDGKPHLVGRLWAHVRKNKENASFEYDNTWLENPVRFSLEPALQVGPGTFHTPADTPMFGAIGDSAPDRAIYAFIAGVFLRCFLPAVGCLPEGAVIRNRSPNESLSPASNSGLLITPALGS